MFFIQALLHARSMEMEETRKVETHRRERERDRVGQINRSTSATSAGGVIHNLCARSVDTPAAATPATNHLRDLHLILFGSLDFGPRHNSAVIMLSQDRRLW